MRCLPWVIKLNRRSPAALPIPLADASGHRGGDFQGLMDANEIVVHEIDRHHVRVVCGLLAKGVRQSRHPSIAHADIEILALGKGRADFQTGPLPEKEAACFRSGTGIAYRRAVVWTQLYSKSAYREAWCPIRRSPDPRLAGAFYWPRNRCRAGSIPWQAACRRRFKEHVDLTENSVPGIVDAIASQAGRTGIRFLDYRCRDVPW